MHTVYSTTQGTTYGARYGAGDEAPHVSRRARWFLTTAALLVAAAILAAMACRPQPGAEGAARSVAASVAAVSGTVGYRHNVALPPGAVVRVTVQDVSLQDAPARVVGEETMTTKGQQTPLRYEVRIPRDRIDEHARYTVSARIDIDDQLAFISTANYPVLTQDNPRTQDVVVDMVP